MAEALSPLDRLRRRYQTIAGRTTPTFDVPIRRNFGGDIVVVYKEPDWEDVEEIIERWADGGTGERRSKLYAFAELLAKACVDILQRDDDHEDAVERDGLPGRYLPGLGSGHGPVTFHGAAVALGLPVSEDPLVAVFSVLVDDQSVEEHGELVSKWEPPVSREVDERFVGESEAAPPSAASPAGP